VHYPGLLVTDEDMQAGGAEELAAAGAHNEEYDIDVIESHFKQVLAVAQKYGLKVYCGEYGCITGAPHDDRVRWYQDMNTLFNRYGIARANWDYKGGFGILLNGARQDDLIKAITEIH
jgi:endoglucanase